MGLQERFIEAVQTSISNLFDTMIPLDLAPVPSYTERALEPDSLQPGELIGTIDIRGQLSGSISVALSYQLALRMASLLLEEELSEITEEVYEAVAEITNMIAGGIKTCLSIEGDLFSIGLPQVFDVGQTVSLASHVQRSPHPRRIEVPVYTGSGAFLVSSVLRNTGPLPGLLL